MYTTSSTAAACRSRTDLWLSRIAARALRQPQCTISRACCGCCSLPGWVKFYNKFEKAFRTKFNTARIRIPNIQIAETLVDQTLISLVTKWFFIQIFLKVSGIKIQTSLSGFQMVFDKMAAICPDFRWLGFQPFQIPFKIQTICNSTSF